MKDHNVNHAPVMAGSEEVVLLFFDKIQSILRNSVAWFRVALTIYDINQPMINQLCYDIRYVAKSGIFRIAKVRSSTIQLQSISFSAITFSTLNSTIVIVIFLHPDEISQYL